METILQIGTTDYDGGPTGRPAAGIFGLHLRLTVEMGNGHTLSFTVKTCGCDAPFVPGTPVSLRTSDHGVIFVGDLDDPQVSNSELGYIWAYTCTDLKQRANRITMAGLDGSGTAQFNLQPDDALYLYATSGQTVGAIIREILEASTNAIALNGVGVGGYVTMTPPTLPAVTLADLSALSVVPAEAVQLNGESILNLLEQFMLRWHPQYALWVQSDGVIRIRSIFQFTLRTFTVPTDTDHGDPIDWPTYHMSCKECYTAVVFRGLDIAAAMLSVVDGTLVPAWTPAQQAAWTIADFHQPRDASDDGTLSGVTSTSCVVTSDHGSTHWDLNFWNLERGGWIQLLNLAGVGITIHEERLITSCTALASGGSASIGWDSSQPIGSTDYTRYHIRGLNSPMALVDRKFWIAEPGHLVPNDPDFPSGPSHVAIGRETWVGAHLYPRFPKGAWLENLSRITQVQYPAAYVRWSRDGLWPWFELPIRVQIDPRDGSIVLTEPAVLKFGDPAVLEAGYPTSFEDGLWADVRVLVPYNRGDLYARWPATGYAGTAYTKYGIAREKVIAFDGLTWAGDVPSLQQLAAEHLAVLGDTVVEGSCLHHELPTGFNPFVVGHALRFVFPYSSPIDGLNLPVRSQTIQWQEQGEFYQVLFEFSNLKRPFEGDSLYIHPAFTGKDKLFGTEAAGDEGVWVAGPMDGFFGEEIRETGGRLVGFSGETSMKDWNQAAKIAGAMGPLPTTPINQAMSQNPLTQALSGPSPLAGPNRLGQALGGPSPLAGPNPLAQALPHPLAGPNQLQQALAAPAQGGGSGGMGMPSLDTSQFQAGPYQGSRLDRERNQFAREMGPRPSRTDKPLGTPIQVEPPEPVKPPAPPPPPPRPGSLRAQRGTRDDETI